MLDGDECKVDVHMADLLLAAVGLGVWVGIDRVGVGVRDSDGVRRVAERGTEVLRARKLEGEDSCRLGLCRRAVQVRGPRMVAAAKNSRPLVCKVWLRCFFCATRPECGLRF